MSESTISQRVLRRVLLPFEGQLIRGILASFRWILVVLRGITSLVRWLVRLWPSKTQVLVIVASALALLMAFGIVKVVEIHGFAPESAALLVAWATIVGVVITQIVSAKLASDRAQDDTLQAYLKKWEIY